jgi:hypothetical protein
MTKRLLFRLFSQVDAGGRHHGLARPQHRVRPHLMLLSRVVVLLCVAVGPVGLLGAVHADTVGLYNPATGNFYLRNSNSAGAADLMFRYGPTSSSWLPVVGDWDGDAVVTIGLYHQSPGNFYLRNTNSAGAADLTFRYGPTASAWLPVAGDWNDDGTVTIGLYNQATGTFYLRNSDSAGPADLTFRFGPAANNWSPVAGDWNGDGTVTVGLYDPATSTFYLRNSNTAGAAELAFRYGPASSTWLPVVGDWDRDGDDTVGLYNPTAGTFYLRNANAAGAADVVFRYGPAPSTWKPIAGDWVHYYDITEYWPLAEGNTLSYEATEWYGPFADTVSGTAVIDEEEWTRLERDNGRVAYMRQAAAALYMKGADLPSMHDPSGEIRWTPPLAFPNGLHPGDSGLQTMATTLNGLPWGTTTFTWLFVGPDAVSTHAGEFEDCMKFYVTLTLPGESEPSDDGYEWFARGVGDVKQDMVGYWHELFSATVGGVHYPADGYWLSDYYPLGQGDTWTYTAGPGSTTQTVIGTAVLWGREYVCRVNAAENQVSYEQVTSAGYYHGGEFYQGHLTTFYPAFFTPNGMRPGDILQQTSSMYVDGELQGDASVTGELLGIEDVTVPAGFFPACLKLDMCPLVGPGGKRWWWAEGVGQVRSDETPFGGTHDHLLLSAVVGGVHYP